MDDVRGLFLGMPHGTTPAAGTTNKNIIIITIQNCRGRIRLLLISKESHSAAQFLHLEVQRFNESDP